MVLTHAGTTSGHQRLAYHLTGRHHGAGGPTCRSNRPGPRRPATRTASTSNVNNAEDSATAALRELRSAPATDDIIPAGQCPALRQLRPLPPPTMSALETLFLTVTGVDLAVVNDRTFAGQPVAAGYFLGLLPAAMVGDMSAAKDVAAAEAAGKLVAGWPDSTRMLMGEQAVICVNAEQHRTLRQAMAPALSAEAVESYLPDIHALVVKTLDDWVVRSAAGDAVLALPELKRLAFRIILSVVDLQLSDKEEEAANREFTQLVANLFSPAVNVWPAPFWFSMQARLRLVRMLKEKITKARAELAQAGAARQTARSTLWKLLSSRDDRGLGLTDEQVIDNLIALLFAGHDTSAAQLTGMMFDMALRPDVMARVRDEQAAVVAKHGPGMTAAALRDMKYTSAVLAEGLRCRNPVGGFIRQAADDVALGGVVVPKGKPVVVGVSRILSRDERWPYDPASQDDPLHSSRFNPDRFLTEDGAKQGAQIPFGLGAHTCVGQALAQAEAKVFLATLARGYTYKADVNTKWQMVPLPHPENSLPVTLDKLPVSGV